MIESALFTRETQVIASAESALRDPGSSRAALDALLLEYRHLTKTIQRLVKHSDRNERQLRAVSDDLSRKNRELEVLSGKLSKYLAPQVYDSIFASKQEVDLTSRRKKLTIFFSDLCGFTELTDRMEPEDITTLINRYLTEMSAVALEYGATIDKYMGDGIMIFFGDPASNGVREDALACVRMAMAMHERMGQLAPVWEDFGMMSPLRSRIGIHTGYCTVGNFGGADRLDYTIIGGPVNIAARLEPQADLGGILVSHDTYLLIRKEIECREKGTLDVRGLAYPIVAYDVVGPVERGEGDARLDPLRSALDLDPDALDPAARAAAADLLRGALERLASGSASGSAPGEDGPDP